MLKMWLTDNGYIVSDQAAGLIDVYVRENKYFVALKLLNGVGVKIDPADRAHVPRHRGVRAAAADRDRRQPGHARAGLGPVDKRVAPRGYYEIMIDEARIDWLRNGSNYFGPTGLVGMAANEAGGNAFVTEFAGPSSVAQRTVYVNGRST